MHETMVTDSKSTPWGYSRSLTNDITVCLAVCVCVRLFTMFVRVYDCSLFYNIFGTVLCWDCMYVCTMWMLLTFVVSCQLQAFSSASPHSTMCVLTDKCILGMYVSILYKHTYSSHKMYKTCKYMCVGTYAGCTIYKLILIYIYLTYMYGFVYRGIFE